MGAKIKILLSLWSIWFVLIFIMSLSTFGAENSVTIEQTASTTFPILINQPGNYMLTSDLVVSTSNTHALEINANEVTIDLNGHHIIGPCQASCSEGSGIYASSKDNIAIMNGTARGFFHGVNLSGANHAVKNINAYDNNGDGIKVTSSTIIDCTADYNGSNGIKAESSTIINCTTSHNGFRGLEASSSTIIDSIANYNGDHGMFALDKCRFEGNIIKENGGYGLFLCPDYSYAIKNEACNNISGNFYGDGLHYLPMSGDDRNYRRCDEANY